MLTGLLKVLEAAGGTLWVLAIALLAYAVGLLWGVLRELRDVKARAKEDRAESNARADRDRADSKERSKDDRALYMRENAQLSKEIAALTKTVDRQSEAIAALTKTATEQSKQIVALTNTVDRQSEAITALAKTATEQSRAITEQSKEIAALTKTVAQQSEAIAEQAKAVAGQSKTIATVQGDVQVLLDRSDRPLGGRVGPDQPTSRYEIARQALPAPREEEGEEESR